MEIEDKNLPDKVATIRTARLFFHLIDRLGIINEVWHLKNACDYCAYIFPEQGIWPNERERRMFPRVTFRD